MLLWMQRVLLLVAAAGHNVSHMSWYQYVGHNFSAAPTGAVATMQMGHNLTFLMQCHEQLGLPGMLSRMR